MIYIRGVDKIYEVYEELLDIDSIHGTTTGTDFLRELKVLLLKKKQLVRLRWKYLKSIITTGAKNMCDKNKGVVALVSKGVENGG